MSMEKEFVSYNQALRLKKLGFDERVFSYFEKGAVKIYTKSIYGWNCNAPFVTRVSRPTFSQAFRWFDDNTECSGYIVPSLKEGHFDWLIRIDWEEEIECEEAYSSRKEAELACLDKLIEIVESKSE